MNGLSNLDKTYREYSLAPTDDLIRFWTSKVKVTAGRQSGIRVKVHLLEACMTSRITMLSLKTLECTVFAGMSYRISRGILLRLW